MTFHYLEDLHTPTRSSGSMRDTRRAFALRNRDRSSPPSSPLPPPPPPLRARSRSPSPCLSRFSLWLDTHAPPPPPPPSTFRRIRRASKLCCCVVFCLRFLASNDSDGRIGRARLFVFEPSCATAFYRPTKRLKIRFSREILNRCCYYYYFIS